MGSISGSNELVRALTKEQFLLAFGGRYDQCMMMQLPMEIRKQTKPLLDYSKYYMKYRDAFYRLHMPCKKNDGEEIEPDDQAIISMVRHGLGITILPEMVLFNLLHGIKVMNMEGEYFRSIGLATPSLKKISPAAKRFIETVKTWLLQQNLLDY